MKLRTPPTGAPEAHALRRGGQRLRIDLAQLLEARRRQRIAGDVLHVRGQIADDALRVDETRLLGAGRAKSNELHGGFPPGYGRLAVLGRRRPYPVASVPPSQEAS